MYKTMVFTTIVVLVMSTVAPAAIWQNQQTQAGHVAGTATIGVWGTARQNNTSTAAAGQAAGQGAWLGWGGIGVGNASGQGAISNVNNQSTTRSLLGAAATFFWGGARTNQQSVVLP
jgi:hypothetical protein